MNARNTDDSRVSEGYEIIQTLKRRIDVLGLTRKIFLSPNSESEQVYVENIHSLLYRACEELGSLSEQIQEEYSDIPWYAIKGMRNRLAHDYKKVSNEIVWDTVTTDLIEIETFCESYADDHNLGLCDKYVVEDSKKKAELEFPPPGIDNPFPVVEPGKTVTPTENRAAGIRSAEAQKRHAIVSQHAKDL